MVDVQTIGVLVTAASVSVAAIYYTLTMLNNSKKAKMETTLAMGNLVFGSVRS